MYFKFNQQQPAGLTNLVQRWSTPHTGRCHWAGMGCQHLPCWLLAPGTGTSGSPSGQKPADKHTWSQNFAPAFKKYLNFSLVLDREAFFMRTHPVGPLADSLYVGFMPLPSNAISDLTVIHEVSCDVSTTDEGWLLPGQHHGVTHTLQDADAIGWSRGGCDDRKLKLTPQSLGRETRWCNGKLKR